MKVISTHPNSVFCLSTDKTAFIVNCLPSQTLPLASCLYLMWFKCLAGLQGGRALLAAPQPLSNTQLSPAQTAFKVAQALLNSSLLLCSCKWQSCIATPLDGHEFRSVHFIHTTSRAVNRHISWVVHEDLWMSVTLALADVFPWVTEV